MRYAVMTLLIIAGLQALRGEFMAALYFLILAAGTHVADRERWRRPRTLHMGDDAARLCGRRLRGLSSQGEASFVGRLISRSAVSKAVFGRLFSLRDLHPPLPPLV